MNEQMLQSMIEELGATISQLTINLAVERATVRELSKQLEEANTKIEKLTQPAEMKAVEEVK